MCLVGGDWENATHMIRHDAAAGDRLDQLMDFVTLEGTEADLRSDL